MAEKFWRAASNTSPATGGMALYREDIEARLAGDKDRSLKAVMSRSQRDLHRRHQPHPRNSQCHGPRTPSGAADRGCRSLHWPPSIFVTTNGELMSRSPVHKRASCFRRDSAFNAISEKALAANRTAKLPRSYWDWQQMLESNRAGYFPFTPATNLLLGLREALHMLEEEGLPNVFQRHQRHGEATRAAVSHVGPRNPL